MRKLVLFSVCLCFFISTSSLAQYDKGDMLVNAGVGVNTYYSGGLLIGSSFEYGLTDAISGGIGINFIGSNYGTTGAAAYDYNVFYLGARGSYHINKLLHLDIDRLDLYVGTTAGYRFFNWRDKWAGSPTVNPYRNRLYIGATAGARYYFTPSFGVYAEFEVNGAVNSTAGLTLKF